MARSARTDVAACASIRALYAASLAAAVVTAPYGVSTRDGVEEISGQWFTKFIAGPTFTDTTDDEGAVTTAAANEAAYKARVLTP